MTKKPNRWGGGVLGTGSFTTSPSPANREVRNYYSAEAVSCVREKGG